jgi:type I restriction-modification system DNA methylase subunit
VDYHEFLSLFHTIAKEKHRYTVFSDFVTISAISLRNVLEKNAVLEAEYMDIVGRYRRDDVLKLKDLFHLLVQYLEADPRDCLGELFMTLGFSEDTKGQFFTPEPICDLISQVTFADVMGTLQTKPFITMNDPACGAGAMLLAAAKLIRRAGYSLEQVLWVQAVDIDRMTALMCYIQLSLWNIAAEVIVGNSLTLEYREHWLTFAHHQYGWRWKLKYSDADASSENHASYQERDDTSLSEKNTPSDFQPPTEPIAPSSGFHHTMRQDSFDF